MIANQPRHRHPWPGIGLLQDARGLRRWVDAKRFVRGYNRTVSRDAPTLNFFPMSPGPQARMSLIAARLGMRIGSVPSATEPTIAWDTGTWFSPRALRRLPPNAINGACTDISKSRVDRDWATVAGYSVEVDPRTFEGPLVEKSEINGRHDGRIVNGPIARPRRGFVYQRFVDSVEGELTVDLRTTVIGGQLPVLIRRHRSRLRWYDWSSRSVLADPADEFSDAEREQLLRFAGQIGLDCGELDVLRDRNSGLIYVLDANRTPYGPVKSERSPVVEKVTELMAHAFAQLMAERWP